MRTPLNEPTIKMNNKLRTFGLALVALIFATSVSAQISFVDNSSDNIAPYILTQKDTVRVSDLRDITELTVLSNCTYTVAAESDDDWLSCVIEQSGHITIFADRNYDTAERSGTLTLTSTDESFTRIVVVVQDATSNGTAADLSDEQITVVSGTAPTGTSDFSLSYDGSTSTYYHTLYGSYGSTTFPVEMTWTFEEASHLDYMVYIPRQDNYSGAWGTVTVYYTTSDGTTYTLGTYELGQTKETYYFYFGDEGVDDVISVTVSVANAYASVVTVAEAQFYAYNSTLASLSDIFADSLCTTLAEGLTEFDIEDISNAVFHDLAAQLYEGTYSTDFRVAEYEPYMTVSTLQSNLKTANPYCAYENPTGIYFDEDESVVVAVTDIPDDYTVQLKIKSFPTASSDEALSTYTLSNGLQVITAGNAGNGYISYYSDDYESLPNINVHFIFGQQNGYFDAETMDNDDWTTLLANAVSPIMDIRTKRMQVAAPLAALATAGTTDGVSLAHNYDQTIYREREIMGLIGDNEPKNRQFARTATSGMYASTEGAYSSYGGFYSWCYSDSTTFDFWGFGHELGHNNQTTGFKWSGCGETTNNVYAAWVQHKQYGGWHRLEDESCYINVESSSWTLRGGRFNCYLENAVRLDSVWQRQPGSDYSSTDYTSYTVDNLDGESVTALSKNFDHFVKVVPLWQLELFCLECGFAEDAWGKWFDYIRANSAESTNGAQQLKFIEKMCEYSGYDLRNFFANAGMYQTCEIYVTDYSNGWIKITDDMIEEVDATLDALSLTEAPAGLNFINAYNYEIFRDKTALDTSVTVGTGCYAYSSSLIRVANASWPGAVGYKTYDADGNLLHLSMYGLGDSQKSSTYTYVMWDSSSSYITAVGYDGSEVTVYQAD